MSPETVMSDIAISSSTQSSFTIPKLRDDGSNWTDYEPRVKNALGAKGLWKHAEGRARQPVPLVDVNGVLMARGSTTQPATDDEIELAERKADDYEKNEAYAKHIILSSTSPRLSSKIKNEPTAKIMWDAVVADVKNKSTLQQLDLLELLQSMRLDEGSDATTHLAEMEAHFRIMEERRDALATMGSPVGESNFLANVLKSVPESYRPTVQTIDTTQLLTKTPVASADAIAMFIREARHHVILEQQGKVAGSAMYAGPSNGQRKLKGKRGEKGKTVNSNSGVTCFNCNKKGHKKADCWAPGGGKEGQGPQQKSVKKSESANIAQEVEDDDLFAFTCTSDHADIAEKLEVPPSKRSGIVDSGASRHFCSDRSKFINFTPLSNSPITTADGRTFDARGTGDVCIELPNGNQHTRFVLKDAIYAPQMAFTLISIGCLTKGGYSITFAGNTCKIINPQSRVVGIVPYSAGLYRLVAALAGEPMTEHASVATTRMTLYEAHRKLGHVSYTSVRNMVRTGMVTGIELDLSSKEEFCEACAKAKSDTQPYPKESTTRAENYGQRVHWDLWGPAAVKSLNGKSYAASRKDDATREVALHFLAKKSETLEAYRKDETWILNHGGSPIQYLRCDRGGEFTSNEFNKHLEDKGTQRELTVHDSPPQNGVSERGMRTRAEATRALLLASGLPRSLWAEAMLHSVWLQNRSATRALNGKTPYEMVKGVKPYLGGLQEFGVAAYVKNTKAGKLDARAAKGRFVGYDSESKGYRIYWPDKRSVSIERNVVFNPEDLLVDDEVVVVPGDVLAEGERDKVIQNDQSKANREEREEMSGEDDENVHLPAILPHEPQPEPTPADPPSLPKRQRRYDVLDEPEPNTGRGFRARRGPGAYAQLHAGNDPLEANIALFDECGDPEQGAVLDYEEDRDGWYSTPPEFALAGSMSDEPSSYDEAMSGPDGKEWRAAYKKEIGRLEAAHTWELVDPPPGAPVIPCGMVFKSKRGPDDEIVEHRLRIVAGGHRQRKGVDYEESFSSAAKMPSCRVVLAHTAQEDWEIHQVDVKSAYLYAKLDEVVYMKPPIGYLKEGQEGKVCRLLKCLYGLVQAGRGWQKELGRTMAKIGYSKSSVDHSIFFRRRGSEHSIIAVATDDMAVTGSSLAAVNSFKDEIKTYYDITDLGEIRWFLGFEIKRDRSARTISINQKAYISSMAEKFGVADGKPVYLPMLPGENLSKDQCPFTPAQYDQMRDVPYQEGIGHVLWPVMISRPDALTATGILAQFVQNPGTAHWKALKRLIGYLYTTRDYWLTFGGDGATLEGYSDADWASQPHRHSISGYAFLMGRGAVTWSSKKQSVVALSSTEAEYIAQTHAAKEAIWLRTLLGELTNPFSECTVLHCDNQGAIALSKDNKFHSRTKHIDIRYHFIREAVEDNKILMSYIPTDENVADIFTKPLARPKFEKFVKMLGLGSLEGEC